MSFITWENSYASAKLYGNSKEGPSKYSGKKSKEDNDSDYVGIM